MSIREVDHLVLGSLLHDIGKVLERGDRMDRYRNQEAQKKLDCPHGSYHSLHTRAFCEWLAGKIPLLHPASYDPKNTTEDHWINLASRHHANGKTKLQTQVADADSMASGEREEGKYRGGIEKQVRLESILERIDLNGKNRDTDYRLPLLGLALAEENLFALPGDKFPTAMDVKRSKAYQRDVLVSPEKLTSENRELADGLMNALTKLPAWTPENAPQGTIFTLVRTLLAQLERFLSYVPSATNIIHPDISLFDHLRITAAIAETRYWQTQHENTTGEKTNEPWRLVCGDFSGIQTFLYRITAKNAAKGLRGRSFFVELLCDGVAEHLLRILGLHLTCRIYSSGGRFYLLIPACQEQPLRQAANAVNEELLTHFRGDLFLGVGVVALQKDHFRHGKMGERWKSVNKALMEDRQQRFHAIIEKQPSFFEPLPLAQGKNPCQVCGRGDVLANLQLAQEEDPRTLCQTCHQLERLGRLLTRTRPTPYSHLLWLWGKTSQDFQEWSHQRIDLPIPGGCSVTLLEENISIPTVEKLQDIHLEGLNRVENCLGLNISNGFRFVGRWRDRGESSSWEFGDFAEQAIGIPRYGVLRMDVDNLGEILVSGLDFLGVTNKESEMGSLSRWATVSRQLYRFFSGHLLQLLSDQELDRTQIIYAGGDDLLLIGAWDQLPQVAKVVREKFGEFCSDNPVFTLSAGISLGRDKYPFSRLAELSGEALGKAKAFTCRRGNKNAICFLDTPVSWEDFSQVEGLRKTVEDIVDQSQGNRGIIARLTETVMAQQAWRQRLREFQIQRRINQVQMQEMLLYHRWRWQLVYSFKRFSKDHQGVDPLLAQLQKAILEDDQNLSQPVLDWLALPARWADFLTRKER